jgi:hypothetical protein
VLGEAKPETTRLLAAAGLTVMPRSLPVIVLVTVSVAVSERLPAVLRVALKVCTPWSAAVKV